MPVEDLMDIGTEVITAGAGLALTQDKKEKDKKKKGALLSIIISIFIVLLLVYVFLIRWKMIGGSEAASIIIDELGYVGTIVFILGILIILFLIGLFSKLNKEKKLKKVYLFIFLSALASFMITYALTDFSNFNVMNFIPLVAFTFAIILMFFLLFDKIGEVKINQFLRFPYHLLIRFFIPLMFVCILFLGAMHGKYNYDSVFLQEVEVKLANDFGNVFGRAVYGITKTVFILGRDRPDFFIFVSIALALYLLYSTIRYAFWKDEWPFPSVIESRNIEAKYFINEANDKYLSKEDIDAFRRGKLRLNKKYLEGERR